LLKKPLEVLLPLNILTYFGKFKKLGEEEGSPLPPRKDYATK
jgi:hypothetical protein